MEQQQQGKQLSKQKEDLDILQLHHINGYTGKYQKTIHHLP